MSEAGSDGVHRFETSDGVGIAYRVWGSRAGARVVALQHGFTANAIVNWEMPGIVGALTASGLTVVAPDARGHGDSDAPHEPERYGEARMALDLRELFDHLALAEVDLVGYSMGAVTALIAASTDARVSRLVVGGVGEAVVDLGGVDTRALAPGALIAVLESDASDPDLSPGLASFLALADATGADRRALAAQLQAFHREPIALASIAAPTLVLAGNADPLAKNPGRLAAAIPGAVCETFDGDHFSVVSNPGFVAALSSFLAAADDGAATSRRGSTG